MSSGKRKERMKLSLPPKLLEKLVSVKHKFPQAHSMNIFSSKKDHISWDMSSRLYFFNFFSKRGLWFHRAPHPHLINMQKSDTLR